VSEKKAYPGWTMGVAFILATSSVMPIIVIALMRITNCSKPHADYQPGTPMKRVDTTASTNPMMV
jgi:hypothetical protein